MRLLRILSRLLLGIVFLFSGFVKAVDPLGSAYKFGDYFTAFNLEFLDGISLPLSMFLSAFEIVLGLVLILGYQKRAAYWVNFVFMTFFTLLTFVLALTNPVSDCGCFGDALILTNWETFIKNLVIMVFVLILFAARKNSTNVLGNATERGLILLFFVACFLFSGYNLKHLPMLDFRPYDIGTDIAAGMEIPEDAPADEYETKLFYRNLENGEQQEFTLENYPRDTAMWEFVTSESILISRGYEPPIHDFGIMDPSGMDVTDQLLNDPGYTLIMAAHDLGSSAGAALSGANDWEELESLSGDFTFMPVTSTTSATIRRISDSLGLNYNFYSGDEIMLKTIVRSNPGFVMLKNGVIVGKWSHQDFPAMANWSAEWPSLIEEHAAGQDPEIQMMIEEGLLEEITWDVVDFEEGAMPLLYERLVKRSEKKVWISYVLVVFLVILFVQRIPDRRKRRRV